MVRSPKAKGQRSRASTTPCPIVQSVHPSSGTCFDRSPGGGWCWIPTAEAHHLGCMMWFPRRRRGSRLRGCSWQKTASPKPRHRGCLRVDLRQGLRPNQDLSSVQYQISKPSCRCESSRTGDKTGNNAAIHDLPPQEEFITLRTQNSSRFLDVPD